MNGRAFLAAARHLLTGGAEPHWRAAVGRAYYALLHEGRAALDRFGFPLPPRESIHSFVRLRLTFPADSDLRFIGQILEELGWLRNQADYQLAVSALFTKAPGQRKRSRTPRRLLPFSTRSTPTRPAARPPLPPSKRPSHPERLPSGGLDV
jgi:hypothetical protein